MRTFTQLESDENVTAQELREVFHDYATTGAAISAHVVTALINRTALSSDDRAALKEDAREGFRNQTRRHFPKDANEYWKVVLHLL